MRTKQPKRQLRMTPLQTLTHRVALTTLLDESGGMFREGKKAFVHLARERFAGRNGTFSAYGTSMKQLDACVAEQWMNEESHGGRGRLLVLHLTDKGRAALAEHADIRATFERRTTGRAARVSIAERALAAQKAPRVIMPDEIDVRLLAIESEKRPHQLKLAELEAEAGRLRRFKERWSEQVNAIEHMLVLDEE